MPLELNQSNSEIKQKTDQELAKNIAKHDDNNALLELIHRHTPLCVHIFEKYRPAMVSSGVSSNQLEDKDYIIYQAAKSFDPSRNVKYSTHLANNVRYACLNSMKDKKEISVDSETLDYLIDDTHKKNHKNIENFYLNISYINNLISQLKDERTQKIFQLRYFNHKKLTWKQIGKKVKLSAQMAINLHNKAVKIIRTQLHSQSISDKI